MIVLCSFEEVLETLLPTLQRLPKRVGTGGQPALEDNQGKGDIPFLISGQCLVILGINVFG